MTKCADRPRKGRRRIWLRVILVLLGLGVLLFAAMETIAAVGSRTQISGQPKVMVVLGCQVREDGPSVLLRDRLDTALEYWKEHPDMTVVVTGAKGKNEPDSEAAVMAGYLEAGGVDPAQIILEEASFNTLQNLLNARELLKEQGFDPEEDGIIIVSNGFHLARAGMLAHRLGFGNVSTLAAPTSHRATAVKMFFREPIAIVKSFVLDWE